VIKYTNCADLHVHTTASDGAYTLDKVALMARDAGLEIIAVTDHDNVSALEGEQSVHGVEVVPGVELSAELEGREVHILGYYLDIANAQLAQTLATLREKRRDRMKGILEKLSGLNVTIDTESVTDTDEDASVGRLHVAELLINHGYASNVYEAFRDYLGPYGKAYVPKTRLSVIEAITLVHSAGGAAVLAHPGSFFTIEEVRTFVEKGLDGVEAYYPAHSPLDTDKWAALARENGLVTTAGSDFHGRGNETPIGAVRMARDGVELLHARSKRYGAGRLP